MVAWVTTGRWNRIEPARERERDGGQSVARASRARVRVAGKRLGIFIARSGRSRARNVRARASGDASGDE